MDVYEVACALDAVGYALENAIQAIDIDHDSELDSEMGAVWGSVFMIQQLSRVLRGLYEQEV